jgi:hypothetical protein
MARTVDTKSKADFVRAHPDLSPADLVAAAKAKGIRIIPQYVSNIRFKDKRGTGTHKRGRPSKQESALRRSSVVSVGIVAEIERIVEAKVSEILKSRLGGLFG